MNCDEPTLRKAHLMAQNNLEPRRKAHALTRPTRLQRVHYSASESLLCRGLWQHVAANQRSGEGNSTITHRLGKRFRCRIAIPLRIGQSERISCGRSRQYRERTVGRRVRNQIWPGKVVWPNSRAQRIASQRNNGVEAIELVSALGIGKLTLGRGDEGGC